MLQGWCQFSGRRQGIREIIPHKQRYRETRSVLEFLQLVSVLLSHFPEQVLQHPEFLFLLVQVPVLPLGADKVVNALDGNARIILSVINDIQQVFLRHSKL